MENIKQVIVMRTDLNMRKGKMVAQGAHASMKVFLDRLELSSLTVMRTLKVELTDEMVQWIKGIFTKVCVKVNSEQELLEIKDKAISLGLPVALIEDCGLTEFNGVPTKTCVAIGPARSELIDKVTGHLQLL